jgi:hypothetical protein
MYKVVCPMKTRSGGTWWMQLGNAFDNKDNSINIYLHAMPVGQEEVKLQLRELTEEEMRERTEKRAAYQARGTLRVDGPSQGERAPVDFNGLPSSGASLSSDVPF